MNKQFVLEDELPEPVEVYACFDGGCIDYVENSVGVGNLIIKVKGESFEQDEEYVTRITTEIARTLAEKVSEQITFEELVSLLRIYSIEIL